MDNLFQSNRTNPAFRIDKKVIIGLPNIYYNLSHTGVSFNDLISTNAEGNKLLDVDQILNNLEDDNYLKTNFELETLSFGIKAGEHLQFNFSHTAKLNAYLNYPNTLAELIWNGNAQYIGKKVEFGPDVQLTAYHEFAFGATYQWQNISFGAKLKYLSGVGDISTPKTKAALLTSADGFDLNFETDYQINTSSFLAVESIIDYQLKFSDVNFSKLFSKNTGLAIDLGIDVAIGDKLKLSASVLDLGKINWTENTKTYTSKENFIYDGVDITDIIKSDSVSFEGTLDTLDELFGFQESNLSYSTTLPMKFYLSGKYQFNEHWQFGASLYGEKFRETFSPSLALSARYKLNELLTV
ncbi:MAG TPA: hypothetical protein ENK52_04835, partial [Saprospiraceae bacterium]|nr:hypothetical protein [Saprospiraceae bacterium]